MEVALATSSPSGHVGVTLHDLIIGVAAAWASPLAVVTALMGE